jgi:hypothetical protein
MEEKRIVYRLLVGLGVSRQMCVDKTKMGLIEIGNFCLNRIRDKDYWKVLLNAEKSLRFHIMPGSIRAATQLAVHRATLIPKFTSKVIHQQCVMKRDVRTEM